MNDSTGRFIARHLTDVPRSGIRDFFDIVSSRENVISLGIGEPDFVTPWHIREASMFALDHGATSYTANLGLPALRQAIARYERRRTGVAYDWAREVLVTVGVSEALDLALRAVVNPGDEVLYHEPCFVSYGPLVRFVHGIPRPVNTDAAHGFALRADSLAAAITPRTRVLLLNFPTNPTGALLDRAETEAIAALAVKHDLLVITDEIYAELVYDGEVHHSIAGLPGMKERTVLLNGFSKSWAMTGFRIGYACAPPALTEAMMKLHQYTMMCAPILSQKAAIEAIERGDADIAEMREHYRQRRNYMCRAFADMGVPCHAPRGAFYAFPNIARFGMTAKAFALRLLDEENVACVPGTAFGACGEGFIRCAFATDLDRIKEAMVRIARFVSRLS